MPKLAASVRELQGHGLYRLIDTFRFCSQKVRCLITAQLVAYPYRTVRYRMNI